MNFGIIGFGRIARKFVQAIEATEEGRIYAIGSHTVSMDDPYLLEGWNNRDEKLSIQRK